MTTYRERCLSYNQYGTLRWVAEHDVHVEHLRSAHATTLWSLLHRGFVTKHGDRILLTHTGQEAYETYRVATLAERKNEADLTERCAALLKVSRVIAMRQRHVVREGAA